MNLDFLLGAEIGDSVFALPAIASLGGGTLHAVDRPWCRPNWTVRVEAARRLYESQSYITKLSIGQPSKYDYDLTTYRSRIGKAGDNIASRIARHCNASPDLSQPWLEVEKSKATRGRIIVARGPRWQGLFFPWAKIVETFSKEILFVGLDEEYQSFIEEFGYVERHATRDLLDVAEAIAGSELFIGSQSSPNSVAEGLKNPSVLEVCPTSIDCFYDRASTQYCIDGDLEFEACGKHFKSLSHHLLTDHTFRHVVLLNKNRAIFHDDPLVAPLLARAECRRQGFIPPLSELQAQPNFQKAA